MRVRSYKYKVGAKGFGGAIVNLKARYIVSGVLLTGPVILDYFESMLNDGIASSRLHFDSLDDFKERMVFDKFITVKVIK